MISDEVPELDLQFATALAARDFDRAAQLLERGARIDRVIEREELFDRDLVRETTTHLIDAAASGETDTVAFLLGHGADPNIAAVFSGRTALLAAARFKRAAVVDLLLAHGANLAAMDSYDKRTALGYVVENVDPQIVGSLLAAGAPPSFYRLNFSIDGGANAREVVRLLVKHGADIDELDDWGRTPLMWASQYAEAETIRAMIALGADVNRVSEPNMNGWRGNETALGLARQKDRADVVAELLRAGARETSGGGTGLMSLLARLWKFLTGRA